MAEYRVQVLEDILRRLHKNVDGLHGTVVVSIEGFVVAAYSGEGRTRTSNPVDSPQIAAMAAAIIALGERVLGRLARGEIDCILLDGTEGGIIVVPAGPEAELATMVNQDAKLGMVMYELRSSSREVYKVLVRTAEQEKTR